MQKHLRKESGGHRSSESDLTDLETRPVMADVEAQHNSERRERSHNEESDIAGPNLRSPPAVHSRLSIQVTKSVFVTSERARNTSNFRRATMARR